MKRRRGAWLAAATLAVVAAHGLLLFALAPAWIDPDEMPTTAPVLTVRSVEVAPPAPAAAPPLAVAPALPPTAARVRPAPAASAPEARASAAVKLPSPSAVVEALPAAEATAANEAAAAPLAIELPVYATRVPAEGRWRYALARGIASGQAVLAWQPQADGRYELRLEGAIAGVSVLEWVSRGALDGAGLAPERFAVRRRGRDHQAANFQRDANPQKITFSGPTHELPLLPGVQDRLSWLIQLPAVIEAAPQRGAPGARITLMVVGARGGAELWRFEVIGAERVDDTPALRLLREARRPRETQVEIWLDPARGHLPLRARLTTLEGGPALEFTYQGSTGP